MSEFHVACDYLCVPDGTDEDGNLELSVQVSPLLYAAAPPSLSGGIDFIEIERWPQRIAELSGAVEVHIVEGDDPDGEVMVHKGASLFHDVMQKTHSTHPSERRAILANRLWAKAFRYEAPASAQLLPGPFDCLRAALVEAWKDTIGDERLMTSLADDRRSADVAQILSMLDYDRGTKGIDGVGRGPIELWARVLAGIQPSEIESADTVRDGTIVTGRSESYVKTLFTERADELIRIDGEMASLRGNTEAAFSTVEGTLRNALAAMRGSEGDLEPLQEKEDEFDDEEGGSRAADAGKRKLSAIISVPTLAHYLGCGLQIAVPVEDVPMEGLVRVRFADDKNNRSQWTAFTRSEGTGRGFCPRPNEKTPYRGDFLNMRHEQDGSKEGTKVRRYWMGLIAPNASLSSTVTALHADPGDAAAASGSEAKRRGLACFDRFSKQQIAADAIRDEREPITRISYQEDLVQGFRPDVGIADGEGHVGEGRWREVVQRAVRCTEKELFDQAFYDEPAVVRYLLPRDHGLAIAPEEIEKPVAHGDKWIVPTKKEPELFVWSGESLAVTRSADPDEKAVDGEEKTTTPVNPLYDLGLNMEYRITGGLLPPLREGHRYLFGARLCYVNGAGAPFSSLSPDGRPTDVGEVYARENDLVLGEHASSRDEPVRFIKTESKAPDIHLLWTDKDLIEARSLREQQGESGETLVIRDGSGSAIRIVTPPRISFDQAEIQGQFDGKHEKALRGAFARNGGVRFWLTPETGAFPEARFASLRYVEDKVAKDVRGKLDPIRLDPLNVIDEEMRQLVQPLGTVAYFGRDNANATPYFVDREARELTVVLSYTVDGEKKESCQTVPFWGDEDEPWEAKPVVLRLRTGDYCVVPGYEDISGEDGLEVSLRRITVSLPRASKAKLVLNCGDHRVAREIKLVHADSEPDAPSITTNALPPYGINAVSVTVSPERTWTDYVDDAEGDPLGWPSEPGGATAHFVGRIGVNRDEVGRLRAEARWDEYTATTIAQVDTKDGRKVWKSLPQKHSAKLFEIEVDRLDHGAGGDDWVDLAYAKEPSVVLSPDMLRQLSYNFPDGRARKLEVQLIATSAYGDYYRNGASERSTNSAVVVPIECTFRPPPPVIERTMPVFAWERDPFRRTSKRTSRVRIYLGEDWYASGVGEQLGLVLTPAEPGASPCSYFEGDRAPFQRFLSRPGGDPIRDTLPVGIGLAADDVLNKSGIAAGRLYLAPDESSTDPVAGQFIDVDLAVFDIEVDERLGAYVDIEVDLGGAYQPFLHLGLVRYQPLAVEHLSLSYPVEYIVQWLPTRELTVEHTNSRWRARVSGPAYTIPGDNPLEPQLSANLYGFQESNGTPGFKPRWEKIHGPFKLARTGKQDGMAVWQSTKVDTGQWNFSDYMFHIEEYEPLPSDRDGQPGERLVYSEEIRFEQ